jgi:hypothetical protein
MSVSLSPSNLYAEKVFAEHPLSLWSLDDNADYIALIESNGLPDSPLDQRNMIYNWQNASGFVSVGNIFAYNVTRTNRFWNPNVVGSSSGWDTTEPSVSLSVSSANNLFGATSLRVLDTTGNSGIVSDKLKISVTPNSNYSFSFYVKGQAGKTIRVSWTEYDSLNVATTEGVPQSVFETSGVWDRFEISGTTKPTTNKISLNILNDTGGSHTFYLDGFLFELGLDAQDYFDGSFTNAYWNGVANDSTSTLSYSPDIATVGTPPFPNLPTSKLTNFSGGVFSETMDYYSNPIFNTLQLSQTLKTVSFSSYFFFEKQNVQSVRLGYRYDSTNYYATFDVSSFSNRWLFLSKTFDFSAVPLNKNVSFFFEFVLKNDQEETPIYVNGQNVGQWAEEFCGVSVGAVAEARPENIVGIEDYCDSVITANAYGLSSLNGYYLIKNGQLLGKNTGIPLVFGAANLTALSPNPTGGPSVIVPGYGFLNDSGKNTVYTSEFWIRVNANTLAPRKIFGPLASNDGLYVDGSFLTLNIGSKYQSHYMSEWYRPMLVHITYFDNTATLTINGEQVFTIQLDDSDLNFPAKSIDGVDQDWLGFYAYPDVPQVEIDCVGIYSYRIPEVVAKRRWVFGQGVDIPENLNSAYNGTSVVVDYSFANYSNNYGYPNNASWGQGIIENAAVENSVLSTPTYSLPTANFDLLTAENWYTDLTSISGGAKITLRPNTSWDEVNGYLLFDQLSLLRQGTTAIYGIFEAAITEDSPKESIIFKIEDESTGEYFAAILNEKDSVDGTTISLIEYRFKSASSSEVLISTGGDVTKGNTFAVGLNFDKYATYFASGLPRFFSNKSRLKVYLAGDKSYSRTFAGTIVRFGFCTPRNFAKIQLLFNPDSGTVDSFPQIYDAGDDYFGNAGNNTEDPLGSASTNSVWEQVVDGGTYANLPTYSVDANNPVAGILYEHVASYTLTPKEYFGEKTIDIATDSYWEDYVPLKYFGKNVLDQNGDIDYGLDFLQFNLDHPKPIFLNPDGNTFNTVLSEVRCYVTFQYANQTDIKYQSWFTDFVGAPKNGVIVPDENWMTTLYEVVDGTVVYVPRGVDFEALTVHVHLEFPVDGILNKKVKLKNLQISGKALDSIRPNKVGTRFGTAIYPYKRFGNYFDYKQASPYTIYKGSTPYMYLTRTSGIQPVGTFGATEDRGIAIPINSSLSSRYRLTAIQATVRFEDYQFPTTPLKIAEIDGKDKDLEFFIVSTHPDKIRAKIYAIDTSTGQEALAIKYYLNGDLVVKPEISLNEWNMLGLSFGNSIDLDSAIGAIRFTGPIMFNNLSFYEETAFQRQQSALYRQWYGVKNGVDPDTDADPMVLEWDDWNGGTWNDVLVISGVEEYGVSPTDIYSAYTGTNKIIVSDGTGVQLGNYAYTVYKDVVITTQTITPV